MSKRTIGLYYYNSVNNFGDKLNIPLLKKLFNVDIEFNSLYSAELVCIGSLLESFLHGSNDLRLIVKKTVFPKLKIWGTGFIGAENTRILRPNNFNETFFRRVEVSAIRGELSRQRVEKILNKNLNDIIVGDPGLLANKLLEERTYPKKYRVGIIPHFVDSNQPKIQEIHTKLKDSTIIDILQEPIDILTKISECECIISSAMHGLIAADSIGIPNVRMIITDKIIGENYKYNDYYSAFGIQKHLCIDIRKQDVDNELLNSMIDDYPISYNKVVQIQNLLIKAFPIKGTL